MSDVHTREQRSRNMSTIRGKDTKPEMIVRRAAHRLGYRFRLHLSNLAGSPDLVFPKHRKIINVHGCYRHMHSCRWGSVIPKTNAEFWHSKRAGNVERDRRNLKALKQLGWKVLTIWECKTKDGSALDRRLARFLRTRKAGQH